MKSIEQVTKSYNGRRGCMCGCLGTYSIQSADNIDDENKKCGWDAYSIENVRPRAVKLAYNRVKKAVEAYQDKVSDKGTYRTDDVWFCMKDEWISIEENGRNTTVYFD